MEGRSGESKARGPQLSEISSGIVKLHREYYGKGPTEAKTYALDDMIVCVLKGGFTTVEETLMDDGKSDEVEQLRRTFQRTMQERFVDVVVAALPNREVIGYMSQIHCEPHVAIELFMLAPAAEPLRGKHELRTG